jgi:hypothetical protein
MIHMPHPLASYIPEEVQENGKVVGGTMYFGEVFIIKYTICMK